MEPANCTDPTHPMTPKVPFVYVNAAIVFASLVFFVIPFVVLVFNDFQVISKNHNTVSSYCASPAHYGNRFLLAFTCLIGGSLACILVEEYNSRGDGDWRFWPELLVSLLLPLVGIFYTEGADDQGKPENPNYDCGFVAFPIWVSTAFHYLGSIPFFVVHPVVNTWYAFDINNVPFMVFTVITDLILLLFLMTQAILNLADGVGGIPPRPRLKRFRRHPVLFGASFILEMLLVLFVVVVSTLASMKRNNAICFLK